MEDRAKMSFVDEMKEKVLKGELITRKEALCLSKAPLMELQRAADEIRESMCGNGFDICTRSNQQRGVEMRAVFRGLQVLCPERPLYHCLYGNLPPAFCRRIFRRSKK